MSLDALFKISHGVYVTGAETHDKKRVGSCIDAVMVIEVNPNQIMVSLCKTSFTCQTILKTGVFSLSVLSEKTPFDIIKNFGFFSSRDIDKWANVPHIVQNGLPYLKNACARLELKTAAVTETATHFVFLCDVVRCEKGEEENELTYNYYKKHIQPAPKTTAPAPTSVPEKWVCGVCGHVYEGDIPFEELPDDYVCPICGEPKDAFMRAN